MYYYLQRVDCFINQTHGHWKAISYVEKCKQYYLVAKILSVVGVRTISNLFKRVLPPRVKMRER